MMRDVLEIQVESDIESFPVLIDEPVGTSQGVLVLAPGAGSNSGSKGVLRLRDAMLSVDLVVARFDFPYRRAGKSIPDPMPKLMASYKAVVLGIKSHLKPERLICGGHSMGGRVASMLAARDGAELFDALLLFSYPLHPAGQQQKMRDQHLPNITIPTLCFNGTEDELCQLDLMNGVLPRLAPSWTMHWLQGADHSYGVRASSGRKAADVYREVADATCEWLLGC